MYSTDPLAELAQPKSCDIAFALLDVNLPLPKGWGLMQDERNDVSVEDTLRKIARFEIADYSVPEGKSPCAVHHNAWVSEVQSALGLPDDSSCLTHLMYLFFEDVGSHSDGFQDVVGEGRFNGQSAVFLNLHARGEGTVTVEGQDFKVKPGDVYLVHPSSEHAWKRSSPGLSKAISFFLPEALMEEVALRFIKPNALLRF